MMKSDTATPETITRRQKRKQSAPVVQDIWAAEELEADQRDSEKDLILYRQACGNIRRLIKEILELKKDKSSQSAGQITERRIQVSMLFLTLKKLNRFDKLRNKRVRDATNDAKQKVDKHHLQLQNLLYEVSHLTKEVNKCFEFKSKDEEIELVPEEEFYRDAPVEISKPDLTKNDVHEQRLARLDWELEQRKGLAVEFKKAEANKEAIIQEIASKREKLEALTPCLKAILQATNPLQSALGMAQEVKRVQNEKSIFLPVPLFILFVEVRAYSEAWNKNMKITINGDVNDVKALKESEEDNDEESGDSDQEESQAENGYRRKTVDKVNDMRKKILQKHPLEVVLSITTKEGHTLELVFSYVTVLHIVTVSCSIRNSGAAIPSRNVLDPTTLLDCLFDGDFGRDTPNRANHYLLQRWGMGKFKSHLSVLGHPYLWAQRLAGLDFVTTDNDNAGTSTSASPVPCSQVSLTSMQHILDAIERRLETRLSLQTQLLLLEQGNVNLDAAMMAMFPTKITTRLISFSSLPWEDYQMLPQTQGLVKKGIINSSHFTFTCTLERGSAKLVAAIAVSPHYPVKPPVFSVRLEWKEVRNSLQDSSLWDLEKEVNVHWRELTQDGRSSNSILSGQVRRLAMCFDIYLETETLVEPQQGPQEFVKERMFFQPCRGKGRSKPYRHIPQLGLFAHR